MKFYICIITILALHLTMLNTITYASPTLSLNSKGEYVLLLQEKLKSIGYNIDAVDGNFDNSTKIAVEQFQRDNNLEVTGIVNNATWRLLKNNSPDVESAVSDSSKSKTSSQTIAPEKTSLSSDNIKALQQKLQQLGYNITMIDGDFGNETETAIKAFQQDNNLTITGKFNDKTIQTIQNAKISKSDSEESKIDTAEIKALQQKLQQLGYKITMIDGEIGNETDAALKAFQQDNDLNVTGKFDDKTIKAIKKADIPKSDSKNSDDNTTENKLNTEEIKTLQQKLQQLGYKITMIDGEIGNETESALRAFQEEHNLDVTSTINKSTLKALKNEKLFKIDSNSKSSKNKVNKLNYDEVIILQQNLKNLGYKITMIDGEFGNETKAAVEAFQRNNKIEITGNANPETLIALKTAKPIKLDLNESRLAPFGQILINKSKAEAVVRTAKKYIGVPYVFGGNNPQEGFDCSGFLQYVFKENGLLIPRLADEQYKLGMHAKTTELVAGDLVFFTTYEAGASHCGIYLGEGRFVHTSASRGVRIDLLNNIYWAPRFIGAKKIVEI